MKKIVSIRRIKDEEMPRVKAECPRCGRKISLWFNGGELDSDRCCGMKFSLECVGINLVVRKES